MHWERGKEETKDGEPGGPRDPPKTHTLLPRAAWLLPEHTSRAGTDPHGRALQKDSIPQMWGSHAWARRYSKLLRVTISVP